MEIAYNICLVFVAAIIVTFILLFIISACIVSGRFDEEFYNLWKDDDE